MKITIVEENEYYTCRENKYVIQHITGDSMVTEFKITWGDIQKELIKVGLEALPWRVNDVKWFLKRCPDKTLNWIIRHKLKKNPLDFNQ